MCGVSNQIQNNRRFYVMTTYRQATRQILNFRSGSNHAPVITYYFKWITIPIFKKNEFLYRGQVILQDPQRRQTDCNDVLSSNWKKVDYFFTGRR